MWVIFAMLLLLSNKHGEACKFHDFIAACNNVVLSKDVKIQVTAIINHCNKPIDVTFIVKCQNPQVDWHHTFVTTNAPHNEDIPGFKEPVSFYVDLTHNQNPEEIIVKANFHVNEFKDVPLIYDKFIIRSFDDCMLGDSGKVGRTILGIVLTLALLAMSAAIVGWICHRRKRIRAGERITLVDDMEVDTLSSSQPSSSTSTSTVRLSDIRNGDSPNGTTTAYEPVPS